MCKKAPIISQIIVEERMGKNIHVLVCKKCGFRSGVTPQIMAGYLRDGAPKHCGQEMVIERVGRINYEQRTADE